jgi:uncharacterized UBP type Zn finger protein
MTSYVVDDSAPAGATCTHLGTIADVSPSTDEGCEDCLRAGTRWVHLRECLHCGHVGCCDSSPSRHASAHYRSASHPVARSFEPGEDWAWCYDDEVLLVPADPL